MSGYKFTFEERHRIEAEVLPAIIDDPDYAASEIVRLEGKLKQAETRLAELRNVLLGVRVSSGVPEYVYRNIDAALAAQPEKKP